MSNHETKSFYIRLTAALFTFSFGLATLLTFPNPKDFKHHNGNTTISIFDRTSSPNTVITQIQYVPVGLKQNGSSYLFWTSLLSLVSGGAYLSFQVQRLQDRMEFASSSYAEYSQKLWDAEFREIEKNAAPGDRFMAGFLMSLSVVAIIVTTVVIVVDDVTSSTVPVELLGKDLMGVVGNGTDGVMVIGGLKEHGAYSLTEWSCQWVPHLVGVDGYKDFAEPCSKSVTSRYLLLVVFFSACLSLYTAIRPHAFDIDFEKWKTFVQQPISSFHEWRMRIWGGWTSVALQDVGKSGEVET